MVTKLSGILKLFFACGLWFAVPVQAIPVTFIMVTDTLLVGRAVLSGDFDALNPAGNVFEATMPDGSMPKHWTANVHLYKAITDDPLRRLLDIVLVEERHISNPPPHAGEATPGPLLSLTGNPSLYAELIEDFAGSLKREVKVEHDNPSHFDIMTTRLTDLNPTVPKSVTAGARREFRLSVDFRHTHTVPEPGTLMLLATAILAFGLVTQRNTRRTTGKL